MKSLRAHGDEEQQVPAMKHDDHRLRASDRLVAPLPALSLDWVSFHSEVVDMSGAASVDDAGSLSGWLRVTPSHQSPPPTGTGRHGCDLVCILRSDLHRRVPGRYIVPGLATRLGPTGDRRSSRILEEFFDVGCSRRLPWTERPKAAALLTAATSTDRPTKPNFAIDGVQVGFDVGGGGRPSGVGVPGVRAGNAIAEVPFHPRQRGMPQPVRGDALGGDPGQLFADAFPEVVVAAAGDRLPVAVPQQSICGRDRATAAGVLVEVGGEVEGDRLPAQRGALLGQLYEAVFGIEVGQLESECSPASAGGLGVQTQQQSVQDDIVAGGPGGEIDLLQLLRGQGTADAGQAAGLDHPVRGTRGWVDQPVGDGPVVDRPGGGDHMLAGVPAGEPRVSSAATSHCTRTPDLSRSSIPRYAAGGAYTRCP